MLFVGLDLSTKTGVAIIKKVKREPELIYSGVVSAEKEGTTIHRASKLSDNIMSALCLYKYKNKPQDMVIAIEGYGFTRVANIRILFEIGTLVRYTFMNSHQAYYEVPPSSLKKFVTGKGNAKKEMMMKEIYKRWGIDCDTNDEADAVGLAMMAYNSKYSLKMPVVNASVIENMQSWLVH